MLLMGLPISLSLSGNSLIDTPRTYVHLYRLEVTVKIYDHRTVLDKDRMNIRMHCGCIRFVPLGRVSRALPPLDGKGARWGLLLAVGLSLSSGCRSNRAARRPGGCQHLALAHLI